MSDRLAKLLKILAADPGDAFTHYGVAQEYAKVGDVAKASEHYDLCLKADPTYAYACYHKAKLLSEHDRLAEAVATIEQGIGIARAARDSKALSELQSLLDSLT